MKENLFDALGGLATLEVVHKIFYDKVFEHHWLKQYFINQNQALLERQQTEFMAEKMGGSKNYSGKPVLHAHIHLYITEELFDIRHALLKQSILEKDITESLMLRWLKIDYAFKKLVIDTSLEDFHQRYTFKSRIIVDNPE